MDGPKSPLLPMSPIKKKHALSKKLSKILKQQQQLEEEKDYHPGKITIHSTQQCKPKVVNFFGDVHTEVFSLHTSDDDQFVASGCSNGDIKIYHIYEGKILMMGNTSRKVGYPNTGIRWRPKSNREFTACNCDGTIKWYDRLEQITLAHHEQEAGYLCVDYNCSGDWSVYGNERHEIHLFDGDTKKFIQKYQAGTLQSISPNHTNRIFSIKGVKDEPNLFFSGGWDDTVRLWDVRVPKIYTRKFYGPSVSADSLDLKGNTLLAGNYSNKNSLQLWNFQSGELITNLDIQESEERQGISYCFAASYAHKSKFDLLAAGFSGMNKIKIFNNQAVVAELEMQAAPLSISFYQFNNKDFMVASGVEGTIYVIKLKIIE